VIAGTGFRIVDVDGAWPRYARRAARARTNAATLQQVQARCRSGLALCLECEDGLAVVTLAGPPGGFELKVLLAVSRGGRGAFSRQEPSLVSVARDMGAASISFRTNRAPAWARKLGPQWSRVGDDKFWRTV
jgi:hypothetical protein